MKAKTIPILEELRQTKDDLAREAGDDVAQICENTRLWAAAHPHSGPVVADAAELREWIAGQGNADLEGGRAGPPSPPTFPPEWAVPMKRSRDDEE